MITNEKLTTFRLLLGDDAPYSDDPLRLFLTMAGDKIMNRRHPYGIPEGEEEPFPSRYSTLQVELALFLFNKQGAEGQTAHSEGGISRTFVNENTYLKEVMPLVSVP